MKSSFLWLQELFSGNLQCRVPLFLTHRLLLAVIVLSRIDNKRRSMMMIMMEMILKYGWCLYWDFGFLSRRY